MTTRHELARPVAVSLLALVTAPVTRNPAQKQAGFHVPGDANTGDPGLRVVEVPAGALVSWAASDTFISLTRGQAGRAAGDDSLKAIVQAAVSGLLIQLGHTVTETTDSGDLVVLADAVAPADGKDSR